MHSIERLYLIEKNNVIYLLTEIEKRDIITITTVEAYNTKKHKVANFKHFGSVESFLRFKGLNKKNLTLIYEDLTYKQVNIKDKKSLNILNGKTFVSSD